MTQLALQTLVAIDRAIRADQGNTYRSWLQKVLPHLGDAYRVDASPFRSHLGASGIGKQCARSIWYGWRWATTRNDEARMLRLFNRGHLEEGRFIAALCTIGCQVYQQDANGNQYRIGLAGGHYGGSGDGVVTGCPDLPAGMPALSEFKTHNDKSFKELAGDNWEELMDAARRGKKLPAFKGKGVKEAKPEHYIQCQQYARHMGLPASLYMACNKNDDSLYAEILPLDPECADKFSERGVALVFMRDAPKRVSESPAWYGCRFCDHKAVCHFGEAPARNCRTCTYSEPRADGKWYCTNEARHAAILNGNTDVANPGESAELGKVRQLKGCSMWVKHSTI